MSTVTIADPAHDAELAAIEKSGWAHVPFRATAYPAFWLFCWMILLGAVETFRNLSNGFESVGSVTTFMVVLFGVYTLPWVFFLRNVDRWSKMLGSRARCVRVGWSHGNVHDRHQGQWCDVQHLGEAVRWQLGAALGLSVPVLWTEELAKGMGVLLLLVIGRNHVRSAFDGAILGAFVGVGFQVFEDMIYGINGALAGFGQDEVADALRRSR